MVATLSERFPLLKVLQFRQFTLLWLGQLISILGDNIFTVALAWQVLILTGSAGAMSVVVIVRLIPTIIFLLFGGVAADRFPRRVIMLCSDAGRAFVVGLIAVLSGFHVLQLWHLVALSLFFGTIDGFFSPAYQSIQPQLVPKELLQAANAITRFALLMSGIVGPAIGALCIAFSGPASAFALDALSFVCSAVCLSIMRLPIVSGAQEASPSEVQAVTKLKGVRGVVADVREGLSYVTGSTWLWVTISIASLANITFFGPIEIALPKLIYDVYHQGAWLLGIAQTAGAVGAIMAALLLGQIKHLHHRGLLAYLSLLPCGISILLFGLPLPMSIEPFIAIFASVLSGCSLGIFSIIWTTLLQELVPVEKLGRVSSINLMGSYIFLPIGLAFIGILTDRFGPSLIFIFGGILTILLLSIGLCFRDIRRLE